MNKKFDLTEEEVRNIARETNKTIEEVISNYKYALKDLEYSLSVINTIIDKNNYVRFPAEIDIHGYGRQRELENKYICYDGINELKKFDTEELAIVTGFGPTNSPTAGTLASIFKTLELQKETGIYTHIIISSLSALNSRQKPISELFLYAYQFKKFIRKLGFDEKNGEIRTDNFLDHSRTFSIISSIFKINDFIDGEATDEMYKRLNILGNDYSTMVSQVYTVADIVLPLMRDKKKGVIVTAGLEEHLYPMLARVAIERIKQKKGGLSDLIYPDAKIGALYGKLIGGLFPYVKMSKSIKESSINLGDEEKEIYKKIVECGKRNEEVVLQMIVHASNWNYSEIELAKEAYETMSNNYNKWLDYKKMYYDFFIKLKRMWDDSKYTGAIDVYNELFKEEK